MKQAVGEGRGGKMPSFHIDLTNRTGKTEVGYLNGAVAKLGEELGIPVPVNRLLNDTLQAMTDGDIPIDQFEHDPQKLMALLKE
jgi:2-dehydropantoate 2-reductase